MILYYSAAAVYKSLFQSIERPCRAGRWINHYNGLGPPRGVGRAPPEVQSLLSLSHSPSTVIFHVVYYIIFGIFLLKSFLHIFIYSITVIGVLAIFYTASLMSRSSPVYAAPLTMIYWTGYQKFLLKIQTENLQLH